MDSKMDFYTMLSVLKHAISSFKNIPTPRDRQSTCHIVIYLQITNYWLQRTVKILTKLRITNYAIWIYNKLPVV